MRNTFALVLMAALAPLASAQSATSNQNPAQNPSTSSPAAAMADEMAQMPNMDRPTEAQILEISHHAASVSTNPSTAALWKSAHSQATLVMLMQSCYGNYDVANVLARYTAPNYRPSDVFHSPMDNMAHHPKSKCLTVDRIDDMKATAKNAISFRVMYVSDVSGEGKPMYYEMEREPDDTWLFQRASYGF